MFNEKVRHFCDRMVAQRSIRTSDVQDLLRNVIPDGIARAEEADLLIALDRAVTAASEAWGEALVAAIVDFAVWGERPTGRIDAATARWLAGSLACGTGPTSNGARIAFEVVRTAQATDEFLVAFALQTNRREPGAPRPAIARAA